MAKKNSTQKKVKAWAVMTNDERRELDLDTLSLANSFALFPTKQDSEDYLSYTKQHIAYIAVPVDIVCRPKPKSKKVWKPFFVSFLVIDI